MKKTTKSSVAPKAAKKAAEPVVAKPVKAEKPVKAAVKAPAPAKVEKAPAKKAVKAEAPKAAPKAPAKSAKAQPTAEQRYLMVQEAAYFIAEKHGFNGDSKYFWALAEAQIEDQLK